MLAMTIKKLDHPDSRVALFRLERDGEWCEFGVLDGFVTSFGGSVWPADLKDLFEVLPSTAAFPILIRPTPTCQEMMYRACCN